MTQREFIQQYVIHNRGKVFLPVLLQQAYDAWTVIERQTPSDPKEKTS